MKSDAVRIAESKERVAIYENVRDILTNPALDVVAGFLLVEFLQSHEQYNKVSDTVIYKSRVPGGGWMGSNAGTALEAGLIAYLLAPSVVQTAKQIEPLAKALGPLLLKAGA